MSFLYSGGIEIDIEVHIPDKIRDIEMSMAALEGVMDDDLRAYMDDAVDIARDLAPVDTGRLLSSIRVEGDFLSYTLIADPRDDKGGGYAIYPEFGTSKQVAQPYARPAILEMLPKLFQKLQDDVKELL